MEETEQRLGPIAPIEESHNSYRRSYNSYRRGYNCYRKNIIPIEEAIIPIENVLLNLFPQQYEFEGSYTIRFMSSSLAENCQNCYESAMKIAWEAGSNLSQDQTQ